MLAPAEQTTLVNFLNAGKGLYIENPDLGFHHGNTTFYSMLGCDYIGDGNASGNVSSVTGETGTFVEGMTFNYPYEQGPDSYNDIIGSNGGTIFFKSQDTNGRALCYNGTTGDYRSIHSTIIFGAHQNTSSTKLDLMTVYMNYLTETIGVEEMSDALVQNVVVSPNPAFRDIGLRFTLQRQAHIAVSIYTIVGQTVCNLIDSELAPGQHNYTWKGTDNSGRDLSSGTYILRIETDGHATDQTIVLLK
jgi:hypothetical protein